ncbi:hypothetical protein AB0E56_13115 [Microbacterium sp. NPDC028030]|uniref:hypothetical protein n=1 Tax=Microbacterium sp. NPDC028030 TaxID=3155124 RepID=UPI0033E43AD3
MSDAQQRRTRITYGGHEYSVPADEGLKVIDAMSSAGPKRVEVKLTEDRSLWMVFGPGIAVTVLEDSRGKSPENSVYY